MCGKLAAGGKMVFVLVWTTPPGTSASGSDGGSIARHKLRVHKHGGCRIRVCGLPIQALWLDQIEPKWVHGKRAVVEPDRKLTPDELRLRVCDYFGCPHEPPLPKPQP